MLSSLHDISALKLADHDSTDSLFGLLRIGRRITKRCWRDQQSIGQPRVFCQNSGNCGSTYIAHLLQQNGIERAFHEKTPDLLQVGLDHYEQPLSRNRLVRLLRYTRYNVFFEANNRLFSLTKELAAAFPGARFIHLHRDASESVRSSMSKKNLDQYISSNTRFRGTLAGPRQANAFTRSCHHWANMNRRIHEDLKWVRDAGHEVVLLRFEDLVQGHIKPLEGSLRRVLPHKKCHAVNVRPVGAQGRFRGYSDWTVEQKQVFDRVCGPVMSQIQRA